MYSEIGLRRLLDDLSGPGMPLSVEVNLGAVDRMAMGTELVDLLSRRRLIDAAFFARLREDGPAWAEAVSRIEVGGALAPLPTPRPEPVGAMTRSSESITAASRTNIPALTASFFGRRAELARLDGLLAEGRRLISLLGAPGIGCTTLALRWAGGSALDALRSEGGVWFVPLGGCTGLPGACREVATALSVPLSMAASAEQVLAQISLAIAGRGPALLILDQADVVAVELAPLVARWLESAPGLRVLATSTSAFELSAEVRLDLPPLDEQDALALFLDRAAMDRGGQALSAEVQATARAIVTRLDGHPLAIELAAGSLSEISANDLSDGLGDLLGLLRDLGEDRLEAALRVSWSRLPGDAQRWLSELAVLPGGFFLAGAGALVDMPPGSSSTLALSTAARRRSLLTAREVPELGGMRRFHMLESVRQFAAARGREVGVWEPCLRRLPAVMVELATPQAGAINGHGWRSALTWLGLELDNLVAALRCAERGSEHALKLGVVIAAYMNVHGPVPDLLSFLDLALSPGPGGEASRAMVMLCRAEALRHSARTEAEKLAAAADAEVALDGLTDPDLRARALRALASIKRRLGAVAEARALLDAALALHDAGAAGRCRTLAELGALLHAQGLMDESRSVLEQSVTAAAIDGDELSEAMSRGNLGVLDMVDGRIEAARAAYNRVLEIARLGGLRGEEATRLVSLANLEFESGNLSAAAARYVEAEKILRETGNETQRILAVGNLALVHFDQGDVALAMLGFATALDLAHVRKIGRFESIYLANRATCRLWCGERDAALVDLERGLTLAREVRDLRLVVFLVLWLALARREEAAAAAAALSEAEARVSETGDPSLVQLGALVTAALTGRDATVTALARVRAGSPSAVSVSRMVRFAALYLDREVVL